MAEVEMDTCFLGAAGKRATFGCFKPAEDHDTMKAVCNRLCSTIASTTDLLSLLNVVEITGDQQ